MNRKLTRIAPLLVALLLTFGGAGLGKTFDNPMPRGAVVVGIVCFCSGLWLQLQTESIYRRFELRHLGKVPAERREVLVLSLSYLFGPAVPPSVSLSGDLDADLADLAERKRQQFLNDEKYAFWRWEQPLRAIQHQLKDGGPLKRVILICSPESVNQARSFYGEVLRKYPALDGVRCEVFLNNTRSLLPVEALQANTATENGFDFEDFDGLTAAYEDLLETLKREGVKARDVQIDFTGGQKPTSVVAAVVTLCSNASNQYVTTNPADPQAAAWSYEVLGYDFREVRTND